MSTSREQNRKLVVDKEGIRTVINDGRLDTVNITTMLNATGRSALEKFLKNYVQDKYGITHFLEWSDRAEALLRRKSALDSAPVLTAPASQTVTGHPEAMYVKFEYFYWYVEPKDEKTPVHRHDREAHQRVLDAQMAEMERQFEMKGPDRISFFGGAYPS